MNKWIVTAPDFFGDICKKCNIFYISRTTGKCHKCDEEEEEEPMNPDAWDEDEEDDDWDECEEDEDDEDYDEDEEDFCEVADGMYLVENHDLPEKPHYAILHFSRNGRLQYRFFADRDNWEQAVTEKARSGEKFMPLICQVPNVTVDVRIGT